MKLTGTNRPITYTTHHLGKPILQKRFTREGWYKETRLLASTMLFPNNKPATRGTLQQEQNHNRITTPHLRSFFRSEHVVTPQFSHPHAPRRRRVRSKGYGGHSVGETPGPIPNPEAKTHSADGTAPGRVWESRSPPEHHSGRGPPTTLGVLPHLNPHLPTDWRQGPFWRLRTAPAASQLGKEPPMNQPSSSGTCIRPIGTLGIPLAGQLFWAGAL